MKFLKALRRLYIYNKLETLASRELSLHEIMKINSTLDRLDGKDLDIISDCIKEIANINVKKEKLYKRLLKLK